MRSNHGLWLSKPADVILKPMRKIEVCSKTLALSVIKAVSMSFIRCLLDRDPVLIVNIANSRGVTMSLKHLDTSRNIANVFLESSSSEGYWVAGVSTVTCLISGGVRSNAHQFDDSYQDLIRQILRRCGHYGVRYRVFRFLETVTGHQRCGVVQGSLCNCLTINLHESFSASALRTIVPLQVVETLTMALDSHLSTDRVVGPLIRAS